MAGRLTVREQVAEEVRTIVRKTRRWIGIASAFPFSPSSWARRDILDRRD